MVLLLEFGTNIFFGVSAMTLKVIPLKEGTKMPKPHKCRALWQHLVFCVYTFFQNHKTKSDLFTLCLPLPMPILMFHFGKTHLYTVPFECSSMLVGKKYNDNNDPFKMCNTSAGSWDF